MEIITYVRDGAITHRDDLGTKGARKRAMFR
jgi:redox-sensitive bicupin YhaK (pirin superfamily)